MATLKAIAQEVGVSIQTVSCVLNRGDIRFSEETKKRIHEVAKRLNYRVNHQARSLVGAKSGMLGMMKSLGFSYDHLEAIVLAGQAIHKFGYGVLSCDIPWYKNGLARAVDAMLDSHVEGVLLINVDSEFAKMKAFKRMIASGIPVVTIGPNEFPNIPRIYVDQYQAVSLLTHYLLSLGYRRFAMMTVPKGVHNPSLAKRIKGFHDTICCFPGLSEKDAEIIHLDNFPEQNYAVPDSCKAGKHLMQKILKRKILPEVILCLNDNIAFGAIQTCQEAGVRIPEDLALASFGYSLISQYTSPPLTSIKVSIESMVSTAVDLLLRMVNGEKISRKEYLIEFPCDLLIRQSCQDISFRQ